MADLPLCPWRPAGDMPVPRARAPQTATELKPAEGPPALGSGHWAFRRSVMADTIITSEKLLF